MNLIEQVKNLPSENRSQILYDFVGQVKGLKTASNVVLSKLLWEIDKNGYYNEWTYEDNGVKHVYQSIADFARVQFEYSSSTTKTFVKIHEKFVIELGVAEEDLAQLPWGNLRIVLPHVTKENLEYVLKLCKEKQKVVKDWVRDNFSEETDEEKTPKYSFTCSPSQADIFDAALDLSRELISKECGGPPTTDAQVWEFICAQWLMIEHVPRSLEDYLVIIGSRFDVKLGLREDDAPIPKEPVKPEKSAAEFKVNPPKTKGAPFDEPLPLAPEFQEELPEIVTSLD